MIAIVFCLPRLRLRKEPIVPAGEDVGGLIFIDSFLFHCHLDVFSSRSSAK